MNGLPARARLFVAVVTAAALPTVVLALYRGLPGFETVDIVSLALLLIIANRLGTRDAKDSMTIALASVVAMAGLLIVGPWGSMVLAVANALAFHREPAIKRAFNASQLVLSAASAAAVFAMLGGTAIQRDSFPYLILPFVAALAVHCFVNGLLVATIVHLHQAVPYRVVFQGTMAGSVAGYLGYGLFGLLLAVLWDEDGAGVGPAAALLVLLPLFVARWAYEQYAEQQRAYDRTVRALIAAVETKDVYTRGHSERVSAASVLIAREIGMREDRVASLRYAGLLHDIGKLGVPTRVLQKNGRLSSDEFEAIKLHPVRGLEMVREIEFLDEAFAGIMHHHERLDGRGYPMGLEGGAIPEFARVIAVADAFDSMTTTRSYRGARTVESALEELQRCSGTQFDPPFVRALVAAVETNGWDTTAVPLLLPSTEPTSSESFDHYDHDDPQDAAAYVAPRTAT
jgi:putative nucleotidyltransferase with HDIG domain